MFILEEFALTDILRTFLLLVKSERATSSGGAARFGAAAKSVVAGGLTSSVFTGNIETCQKVSSV